MDAEQARPLRLVGGDHDVAHITDQLRRTLDGMGEAIVTDAAAREAAAVLDGLAELRRGAEGDRDERKRQLWGAVAQARADLNAAGAPAAAPPRPSSAVVTAVERAVTAVEEAEARARKKLAKPSAFKRHIEAKRELEHLLDVHGYADLAQYRAALDGTSAAPPVDRSEAEATLAAAEAAWEAFLAEPPTALAGGPELDALRARGYRALGRVVDDGELQVELARLVDAHRRQAAGADQLRQLLEGAGIAAGADPVAVATLVVRAAG